MRLTTAIFTVNSPGSYLYCVYATFTMRRILQKVSVSRELHRAKNETNSHVHFRVLFAFLREFPAVSDSPRKFWQQQRHREAVKREATASSSSWHSLVTFFQLKLYGPGPLGQRDKDDVGYSYRGDAISPLRQARSRIILVSDVNARVCTCTPNVPYVRFTYTKMCF